VSAVEELAGHRLPHVADAEIAYSHEVLRDPIVSRC
jgi:hypothetical protein